MHKWCRPPLYTWWRWSAGESCFQNPKTLHAVQVRFYYFAFFAQQRSERCWHASCFSRRFDTSLLGSWMCMAKFILVLAPGPFWSSQGALSSHHPLLHDMDINIYIYIYLYMNIYICIWIYTHIIWDFASKSESHPGILVVLLVLIKLGKSSKSGCRVARPEDLYSIKIVQSRSCQNRMVESQKACDLRTWNPRYRPARSNPTPMKRANEKPHVSIPPAYSHTGQHERMLNLLKCTPESHRTSSNTGEELTEHSDLHPGTAQKIETSFLFWPY